MGIDRLFSLRKKKNLAPAQNLVFIFQNILNIRLSNHQKPLKNLYCFEYINLSYKIRQAHNVKFISILKTEHQTKIPNDVCYAT